MQADIQTLFEAGAHFGYRKSRRHPTAAKYIFGSKDRNDIFDLERTVELLENAKTFTADVARSGKQILFVGGKPSVANIVRDAALKLEMPYVTGRWIGGTLTNFEEIRKRVNRLERLRGERDRGEREKYTKLERLRMDREIEELERRFDGIVPMQTRPAALFTVDPRHELTAMQEAKQLQIPIIGLASSDCNFNQLAYPIPANDNVVKSVKYIVEEITDAFEKGKSEVAQTPEKK